MRQQQMLSKKEIIRRATAIMEHANEQVAEAKQETTGMLQVVAALLKRLGGSVTIAASELAETSGQMGMTFDDKTQEYTFELLIKKADATVVEDEPATPEAGECTPTTSVVS